MRRPARPRTPAPETAAVRDARALLHYLPAVVRDGGVTAHERAFVRSLLHRRRQGDERLTDRQARWWLAICRAFLARAYAPEALVEEASARLDLPRTPVGEGRLREDKAPAEGGFPPLGVRG